MCYLEFVELLAGCFAQGSNGRQSEIQELPINPIEIENLVKPEKDINRIVTKDCELSVILHLLIGYLQCVI